MYCNKCGSMVEDGTAFCGSCGSSMQPPAGAGNVHFTERNTGLTLLLSLLWIGAGHLYLGLIKKGIGIMVTSFVLVFLGWMLLIISGVLAIVIVLIPFILYIWSIFDAYGLAKEYNSTLRRTGNPPW